MKKIYLILFLLIVGTASAQWYNIQWPPTAEINEGGSFNVYAQVWIGDVTNSPGQSEGLQAWIGVSSANTDPSTWSEDSWSPASFNGDNGNNDEFTASIGSDLSSGTYYYASRFLYEPPVDGRSSNPSNDVVYWYGGTGGPWNNDSGVLTVNAIPSIEWANLQWPPNAAILEGNSVSVYAQVYMSGVTSGEGQGANIYSWIGVSTTNDNPATWDESVWIVADYLGDVGNNDEYTAAIGSSLSEGTYYYASRFLYQVPEVSKSSNEITNGLNYYYGGFSGGAWDSLNNVSGVLTVSSVPDTVIDWANLQWPPEVNLVNESQFNVYGQVYESGVTDGVGQGAGIEAWFGLNDENTDPSTWDETAWSAGTFNVEVGNNDEYMATLSVADLLRELATIPFSFYYAARYRVNGGDYYYAGFQGGAWDGVNNVNGMGTFSIPEISTIGWCNLQWPPSISIEVGGSETVYAQLWVDGLTSAPGATEGIPAYIGVHTENVHPSLWPDEAWVQASFNDDVGNNDEYMAQIGSNLSPGTYYYASKFVPGGVKSFYGGYNAGGGGFWDGVNNVSGVLTINPIGGPTVDWCNLQWPLDGNIQEGNEFIVYAQTWIQDVTSIPGATPGLSAWIGVNTENSDPATWDENAWKSATFNVDAGNNDEFMADIGSSLSGGTYYYASRFQIEDGSYSYGGYNAGGGGFWDGTNNVSGTLVVDPSTSVDEDKIPTEYALSQNYPNPFNPTTTISFSLPFRSNVVLKIYNIMGEEIANLANNTFEAGVHSLNWDAANYASGLYILRIEAVSNEKNFVDMKKMMLVR